ncbi:hypothetical protein CWB73_00160 [Pseudoalteromonas phenolica]|uniref:Lipoprotein n=1 Tax=Pseudoalteromonas phenolica TaxID=161398 RepID=A0A4V2EJ95_9GAMM|nr:hypothetical protein [Pseudoalteromonas phenolica]RZQ51568.1 hypothetical protein C1E23_18865 [Pseudoalteromonas phenolica]TMN86810.1 hypothetical protein CWB72_18195 [Pseudoalteromonas phenolica]TMP84249.1 hypothetical protein CWB73_00160 [Pseudoalteromonas phenolica]
MSKITKLIAAASLSFIATASLAVVAATPCSSNCSAWAKQQQLSFCARVGGGSACASSQGLYNHLLQQCKKGQCQGV